MRSRQSLDCPLCVEKTRAHTRMRKGRWTSMKFISTRGGEKVTGAQAIVQGLANNSLDISNTGRQIVKESMVSLINAAIISLAVFGYNWWRYGMGSPATYSVSLSLFCVVMFAALFGTFVPMTLEKLKIDPAIATGPFITTTNDILAMVFYMGITVLLA